MQKMSITGSAYFFDNSRKLTEDFQQLVVFVHDVNFPILTKGDTIITYYDIWKSSDANTFASFTSLSLIFTGSSSNKKSLDCKGLPVSSDMDAEAIRLLSLT